MSTSARFVVDGFNLYHAIRETRRATGVDCRWLDLRGLCTSMLQAVGGGAVVGGIDYFSAFAHHLEHRRPGTVARHQRYIDALRATGVAVHLGAFKPKDVRYHSDACDVRLRRHEEKETDVAIASTIVCAAAGSRCDALMLVSGDTDLVPALRAARSLRPRLRLVCLFPPYRSNRAFDACTDSRSKISPGQLTAHRLPDVVIDESGRHIERPAGW